jgi:hypothetical protein
LASFAELACYVDAFELLRHQGQVLARPRWSELAHELRQPKLEALDGPRIGPSVRPQGGFDVGGKAGRVLCH